MAEKRQKVVKEYDFRQPEQVSKDQIDALKALCEGFFQKMASVLSNQFGTAVQTQVISAEQMAYSEFVKSIPSPTIIGIIDMNPLRGMCFIELEPNLVLNFIDRLLGGRGETIVLSRGLTDMEYRLVEGILISLTKALKSNWASVIDLEPKFLRIENNPQFAGIAGQTNIVMTAVSEVKVGGASGQCRHCIPFLAVESIMDQLAGGAKRGAKEASEGDILKMKEVVNALNLPFIIELGKAEISLKDLLRLQVGDIMRLNNRATDELTLLISGVPKFKGRPGLVGMKMAVQISQVLD